MSLSSESSDLSTNIYEEVLNDETILDLSSKQLIAVTEINNKLLRVIYLNNNSISSLPEDFFPSLPILTWLDLRDNALTEIPKTIRNHPSLTHLLLQNNQLTSLPDELGTVSLKVLQTNGNPLTYPPKEILKAGVKSTLDFLHNKFIDFMFSQSQSDVSENVSTNDHYPDMMQQVVSYNSVLDGDKLKMTKPLSVQFNEKDEEPEESYDKIKGKCPKLAKSRVLVPTYYQSAKYVVPQTPDGKKLMDLKIKQNYLKELALNKHKNLLATRDKILQDRKNFELLRNWRRNYCYKQQFAKSFKMSSKHFPYDTSPEYMTLLTREDIEKDLPDKYKRGLIRKCKPSVPRKTNNEVHLALKIKQLFENLEAIDLNREGMTPRTEQRMLLSEIQKISEIKYKLSELSSTNGRSVPAD